MPRVGIWWMRIVSKMYEKQSKLQYFENAVFVRITI